MKIAGSTAIVTGGNRGIGEAFVRCLIEGGAEPPETIARAGIRAIEKNIPEMDTDPFAINVRAAKARDPALLERQMAGMLKLKTLSTGR
jgi:NAD(P)-dependent dehydrogenase (short-subunit alcohol dehydrogenase family)